MANLLLSAKQLFLTIYYFCYFLVKGKPEWQCPKHGKDVRVAACCDGHDSSHFGPSSTSVPSPYRRPDDYKPAGGISSYFWKGVELAKRGLSSVVRGIKSLPSLVLRVVRSPIHYAGVAVKNLYLFILFILQWIWSLFTCTATVLSSFLTLNRPPSKTLSPCSSALWVDETPKSISQPPVRPHVESEETSAVEERMTDVPSLNKSHNPPSNAISPQSVVSRIEEQHEEVSSREVPDKTPALERSTTAVPPPPPPPPPPKRPVPIAKEESTSKVLVTSDDSGNESSTPGTAFYTTRVFKTPNTSTGRENGTPARTVTPSKEALKGGIPVFPPSMMAEIAGSGGAKILRSEVNRSPNPTVKERLREASATPTRRIGYGTDDEEAGASTTFYDRVKRARSLDAPRVSRIEDSSSNEAQFIFRPHGAQQSDFYMGRSVYTPISEAEHIRESINRRVESRATTPSVWSAANSRISTPAPYAREEEWGLRYRGSSPITRGHVGSSARNWPPPPNAEGADIGKERFVDSNGVITTACKRVVEKKNEEKWRWLDGNGDVVDERSEFTLMGDRDELMREGPYRAQHFSQHFYVDRDGTTRFEKTNRQYDKGYVVEARLCRSIVRNY